MKKDDNYQTIRLPKPLIDRVDEYIKMHPEYVSRSDLIKEALRVYIRNIIEKK